MCGLFTEDCFCSKQSGAFLRRTSTVEYNLHSNPPGSLITSVLCFWDWKSIFTSSFTTDLIFNSDCLSPFWTHMKYLILLLQFWCSYYPSLPINLSFHFIPFYSHFNLIYLWQPSMPHIFLHLVKDASFLAFPVFMINHFQKLIMLNLQSNDYFPFSAVFFMNSCFLGCFLLFFHLKVTESIFSLVS